MSAYFAQLDENNVVLRVDVIGDKMFSNEEDIFDDQKMINHLKSTAGEDTKWVRCCKFGRIRKNSPTIGGVYDEVRDAFIAPKPFESWIFNEETCCWDPPIPKPKKYLGQPDSYWDEEIGNWRTPEIPSYIWDEEIGNWKPNY